MIPKNNFIKLTAAIQDRIKQVVNQERPNDTRDFGVIGEDYSLLTNLFPLPIPKEDYLVCRSVSYNPKLPFTMTWWKEEGMNGDMLNRWPPYGDDPVQTAADWVEQEQQQIHKDEAWGRLTDPDSGMDLWEMKHKIPPDHQHGPKGEHDHEEDEDGKHFHDVYLPRKMHWLKPGDRVLVLWVLDEPVVVDIVLPADFLGGEE